MLVRAPRECNDNTGMNHGGHRGADNLREMSMAKRLKGKVALVTGGTSGIGRRIVERFIEEGASVVFSGRRRGLGKAVAKATGALFLEADVAIEADAKRSVELARKRFGRLDILVNNAGGPAGGGRVEALSLEVFDRTLAVHARGTLAHLKHAAPIMRAQGAGSVINIGSIAGHRAGYSSSLIYAVAKAAVIHMTRCAAMELGEDGVRVNSISPGGIATGIFAKAAGLADRDAETTVEQIKERFAKMQAIPRAGLTDDIAHAAVYLASEEAGFVNGEDVVIDGGLMWGRRFSESAPGANAMREIFEQAGR
jgi:NAD(P)-dependent dehydrogenase (short-subunit alcohol dehydrogenase family)